MSDKPTKPGGRRPMLRGLIALMAANALGETLRRGFGLPVSGPVLGMVLLLLLFVALGNVPDEVERASEPLLAHLSLFFVPAGVGVVTQFGVIRHEWPAMAVALVGSSILGLLATAALLHALDCVSGSAIDALPADARKAQETPAAVTKRGAA